MLTLLFVLSMLHIPALAQAQTLSTEYTLLEPLPCINSGSTTGCKTGTQMETIHFDSYVQYAFNLIIALAAVLAVLMIVWGGFQYMSSDSYNEKKEGLGKLKNALAGLVLILCSYLILKTVDPRLVAIPVTLVEPIKLKCGNDPSISATDARCNNSLAGFFNETAAAIERYKNEYGGIAKELQASQATVKTEQEKLDAVNKRLQDIYSGDVDAAQLEIDSLGLQRQQIINARNEAQANTIVLRGDLNMRYAINNTNRILDENGQILTHSTPELIKQNRDLLVQSWNNASDKLDELGGSYDKQTTLDDTYFLVAGELDIKEITISNPPVDAVTLLKKSFDENYAQISDETKKEELKQSYETQMRMYCPQVRMAADYERFKPAKEVCANY